MSQNTDNSCAVRLRMLCLNKCAGIVLRQYDAEFKKRQHASLSILKEFGFGKRLMEVRILREVSDLVDRVRKRNGEPFDPDLTVTTSVANVVYSILFGKRLDCDGPRMARLVEIMHTMLGMNCPELDLLPLLRFIPAYRRRLESAIAHFNKFDVELQADIEGAMDENEPENFTRNYADNEKDPLRIKLIIHDLVIAGTETSASTLRWCLVLLANHPDIQARLRKQIDSVVASGERLPSLDDRPRLPYVEAALLEVMRLKTLVPLAVPHKTIHDTEVGGYLIPAGTVVGKLYLSKFINAINSTRDNLQFSSALRQCIIVQYKWRG